MGDDILSQPKSQSFWRHQYASFNWFSRDMWNGRRTHRPKWYLMRWLWMRSKDGARGGAVRAKRDWNIGKACASMGFAFVSAYRPIYLSKIRKTMNGFWYTASALPQMRSHSHSRHISHAHLCDTYTVTITIRSFCLWLINRLPDDTFLAFFADGTGWLLRACVRANWTEPNQTNSQQHGQTGEMGACLWLCVVCNGSALSSPHTHTSKMVLHCYACKWKW